MKRILYILSLVGSLAILASCQKMTNPGGTATEALAGQWYVTYDLVAADGEVVMEDFNEGRSLCMTYNTSENDKNTIWFDDMENLFGLKCKVGANVEGFQFGSKEYSENEYYDSTDPEGYPSELILVYDGKIVPQGAVTPSNGKADYVEFKIKCGGDGKSTAEYYLSEYGGDGAYYLVKGWRYTGFVNDD